MTPSSTHTRRFGTRIATLASLSLAAFAQAGLQTSSEPIDVEELPSAATPSRTVAPELVRLAIDDDRLYWDRSPEGVVWVRGADFKASFGPEGASVAPFLGSDAPQNYPVTFALASASVGGVAIDVEHGVPALHEGAHVRFERGAIVESYDLDARSIEQSFDLHAPVGVGDLTLRIAFESELVAQQVNDGIEFRNERGGLDYSHAVAIDARGDVIEMPATLLDGAIEIVVPESFLANAAYPVRVDPTVTVSSISLSGELKVNPDVAYTFNSQNMLVAFERVFSDFDSDIQVLVVSPAGVVVTSEYVDLTTDDWRAPSIASVRMSSRFLVAASTFTADTFLPDVWGRVVDVNAVPTTLAFSISEMGIWVSDVQVSGTDVVDPNGRYLVTWTRHLSSTDTRMMRRVLTASGGFASASIEHPSSFPDFKARVSHTADNGEWAVVWERRVSATNGDIGLGRVQADGTITSSFVASTPADEFNPSVSTRRGGSGLSVVTYETRSSPSDGDVQALVMNGSTIVTSFSPSSLDGSSAEDTFDASVETDGHHFVFTYRRWSDDRPRISEYFLIDGSAVQFGLIGGEYHDGPVIGRVSLASRNAAGTTSRRQAAVWSRFYDIWLARIDGTAGGPYTPMCFGDGSGTQCPCGNNGAANRGCANSASALGAQLSASGAALMGGDTLLLSGSGMPGNTFCLYFQGTNLATSPAVFGDGLRCVTSSVVRLATKQNDASGTSIYPGLGEQPVSIRGGLPAAGGVRSYQLWYRNAANFCTSSTFNLSNGLRVVFTL